MGQGRIHCPMPRTFLRPIILRISQIKAGPPTHLVRTYGSLKGHFYVASLQERQDERLLRRLRPNASQNMSAPSPQDDDKTLYKMTFYVPTPSTKSVLEAVWSTGAGTWPNGPGHVAEAPPKYTETCFISSGTGQFKPSVHADPHIGKSGVVEYVQEDRVEMVV